MSNLRHRKTILKTMMLQHTTPRVSPVHLNQALWHQIANALGDAYEILLLSATPKDPDSLPTGTFAHFVCEIRLRQKAGVAAQPQRETLASTPFLQTAQQLVMAHLDEDDFDYRRLAKHLCLSVSQMNKRLNALVGQSGNEFIRTVRLQQAKHLLLHTDARINEIAFDTGFSCLTRFDQVFKQQFGVCPTKYRTGF